MKNRVLFITEKWCASNPNFGFANYYDNIFNTFSQYFLDAKIHILHIDEACFLYNVHIDRILVNYCVRFNIEMVIFAYSGESSANPSISTLESLKQHNISIGFIWFDNNPGDLALRERLRNVVDINIIIDYPNSDTLIKNSHDLYLWTPESQCYFYPDNQDINVSFIGSSRYGDRYFYVTELKKRVPNILITGGQRENGLTFSAYANLIRRSKIGINFCKNPMGNGYEQLKGRVLEVIASKSFLLEEKGSSTKHFFTPNKDYIEFENIDDLVDKIEYYTKHDNQRIEIANHGYNTFINNYTSQHFWKKVSEHLK
jgi:hypothetical protein